MYESEASILPCHVDAGLGLGHAIFFGQWNVTKSDMLVLSQGFKKLSMCLLPPCTSAIYYEHT